MKKTEEHLNSYSICCRKAPGSSGQPLLEINSSQTWHAKRLFLFQKSKQLWGSQTNEFLLPPTISSIVPQLKPQVLPTRKNSTNHSGFKWMVQNLPAITGCYPAGRTTQEVPHPPHIFSPRLQGGKAAAEGRECVSKAADKNHCNQLSCPRSLTLLSAQSSRELVLLRVHQLHKFRTDRQSTHQKLMPLMLLVKAILSYPNSSTGQGMEQGVQMNRFVLYRPKHKGEMHQNAQHEQSWSHSCERSLRSITGKSLELFPSAFQTKLQIYHIWRINIKKKKKSTYPFDMSQSNQYKIYIPVLLNWSLPLSKKLPLS